MGLGPLGELIQRSCRLPAPAGFKGAASRREGKSGKGKEGREREKRVMEGGEREVDSDVLLEQGRRLAKTDPVNACLSAKTENITCPFSIGKY